MQASPNEVVRKVKSFSPEDLNDGFEPANSFTSHQKVTYNGKDVRLYNGMSDSFKVDLVAGKILVVCKNQFIDHLDYKYLWEKEDEDKSVVRAHFKLIGKGEHGDCLCGACGFEWLFAEDVCDCEQEEPLDAGKQRCLLM